MTSRELVRLLKQYPPDMEIFMEVRGQVGTPTDIDWESGGVSAWLTITDYPLPADSQAAPAPTSSRKSA